MPKENGMKRRAEDKEVASAKVKTTTCPECQKQFEVPTNTVFGEKTVCPACNAQF